MSIVRRLHPLLILAASTAALSASAENGWTLQPSVAARAGYDDNVFLQDRAPLITPATVPDRGGSWFARASAALNALWKPNADFQLNASYSPEIVRYEAYSSENHDNHRLDFGASGRSGPWSYQAKGGVLLVDGSEEAPVFGHTGGTPAIGGAPIRARRDQVNSKLAGSVTRALDGGFVRAVGDGVINDYGTRPSSVAGCANYVDRSEWSAGIDAGRFVKKDFALVTGVRTGAQWQEDLRLGLVPADDTRDYSNRFVRVLAGVEGKPSSTLTLRVLGGPDFHDYTGEVAPGFDRSQSARYLEGSATWTPRSADTFTLTFKDFLWVNAGGRGIYQSTTGNLLWKHTVNPGWSVSLGADVQAGDNRDYVLPAAQRFDWIYTGTFVLTRSLGKDTKLDLEIVREWSDSVIAAKPGREYSRWIVSAGVRRTF